MGEVVLTQFFTMRRCEVVEGLLERAFDYAGVEVLAEAVPANRSRPVMMRVTSCHTGMLTSRRLPAGEFVERPYVSPFEYCLR